MIPRNASGRIGQDGSPKGRINTSTTVEFVREWGLGMASAVIRFVVLAAATSMALAGCQEGANPFALKNKPAGDAATDAGADGPASPSTSTRLVDRDVEAPEVFQVTDDALWDGRPSLGGVWVASPDAVDPERVILRNPGNGKFVIGALFRRERENPGPKLQISSDAADALGLLAGQPGKLNVTALRREEAPQAGPDAGKPILDAAESVQTTSLDGAAPALGADGKPLPAGKPVAGAKPAAAAPAAILGKPLPGTKPAAGGKPAEVAAAAVAAVTAAPANVPAAPAKGGSHSIQIGIFSVEANAKRAADSLKKAGIVAIVTPGNSQGKAFWSVVAKGDGDKAALLSKVKGLGFADAYFSR